MTEQSAEGLVELGNARAALGDHAGAVTLYERALAVDPAHGAAHHNYSLSLTALGRLREAWAEGEWRLKFHPTQRDFMARPPIPVWRGQAMEDELIVLWEQGPADMLQYLRFLALARERVGAVGFLCPPELRRLVGASFPSIELLAPDQPVTWSDYVALVPLLSLPHVMGVDEHRIPGVPYLQVPAAASGDAVGVVWRSSAFDPACDCRLADLQPLAKAGRRLVSLQTSPTAEEKALLRSWGAEERGSSCQDFFDIAVMLKSLRAFVTVDTPVAHLAGGLGVSTHLLLNEPAAVRWMQGTESSPWYPSMRLHRKQADAPWEETVRRAGALLAR